MKSGPFASLHVGIYNVPRDDEDPRVIIENSIHFNFTKFDEI